MIEYVVRVNGTRFSRGQRGLGSMDDPRRVIHFCSFEGAKSFASSSAPLRRRKSREAGSATVRQFRTNSIQRLCQAQTAHLVPAVTQTCLTAAKELPPAFFHLTVVRMVSVEEDFEEVSMARIIIRCKYTGHYVVTSIDTERSPTIVAGCMSCPYCGTEHVWTVEDARIANRRKKATKLIVRQAS